jgi:hypothetical protein
MKYDMRKMVGEKKKKQCPIGMGLCVKAECEWWCDGACAVRRLAEAKQ